MKSTPRLASCVVMLLALVPACDQRMARPGAQHAAREVHGLVRDGSASLLAVVALPRGETGREPRTCTLSVSRERHEAEVRVLQSGDTLRFVLSDPLLAKDDHVDSLDAGVVVSVSTPRASYVPMHFPDSLTVEEPGVYLVRSSVDPSVPWLSLLVVPRSVWCPVDEDGTFVLRGLKVGDQTLRVYRVVDHELAHRDFEVFVSEDGTMRPDVLEVDG